MERSYSKSGVLDFSYAGKSYARPVIGTLNLRIQEKKLSALSFYLETNWRYAILGVKKITARLRHCEQVKRPPLNKILVPTKILSYKRLSK
jgi:hypothetical protein